MYYPFRLTPDKKGVLSVRLVVQGVDGEELSVASNSTIIDGEGMPEPWGSVWKQFTCKAPEVSVSGTWEEIGAQLARVRPQSRALQANKLAPDKADALLAFYSKHFPFYDKLLRGAAQALNVAPRDIVWQPEPSGSNDVACMGMLFLGPEGPFQVYTQERGMHNPKGMGYLKALAGRGLCVPWLYTQ